ncbi:long-chain-fatty-acid--CoA ligase [Mycobacterium sp. 1245852.3]|uniref:long-chain-fatty-acid--CoA ligase n=1 Tax=Mycobacterium sp. 1245852.3 TaxID=1856860 RepID=UPI0009EE1756|nr:long-chain-fatty-acid--CoA ligase [Mycobacterium sp. 1245852.3]
MSRFIADVIRSAGASDRGLVSCASSGSIRLSWREVNRRSRRLAVALIGMGIEPGLSVPILAADPADVAWATQAIWMCAASVTMLQQPTARMDRNIWLSDTLAVVAMLDAKVVVVGEPYHWAISVLRDHGLVVVTTGTAEGDGCSDFTLVNADEHAIALRQLTSGSTGNPKAIEISHGNLWAATAALYTSFGVDRKSDVFVNWMPLSHDMAMIAFLAWPMQFGAELVATTPEQFVRNPSVWPELLTTHRGTITAGPHFAYAILNRVLQRATTDKYDLSSLRVALNGAEPIKPSDLRELELLGAKFGLSAEAMAPGYGLAEATLVVSVTARQDKPSWDSVNIDTLTRRHLAAPVSLPVDADSTVEIASVGKCVLGMEVRIANRGKDCGPRQIGSVLIRGDSVARTAVDANGVSPLTDADGWLDTGDLGYCDEDGFLYICGRQKDVIIVGGRNLYPTDIERAAEMVDGVRPGNVAAVGVTSPTEREGFAIAAESTHYDDDQVSDRIRRDVVHAVTRQVGCSPITVALLAPGSLPKTPSGKLRRHAVATLFAQPHASASP